MFEIGDYVGTVIEGPIVGERMDERGFMLKVRYEDAEGFVRSKWLYPEDLYLKDEAEDGGDGDECCDRADVAVAVAALH